MRAYSRAVIRDTRKSLPSSCDRHPSHSRISFHCHAQVRTVSLVESRSSDDSRWGVSITRPEPKRLKEVTEILHSMLKVETSSKKWRAT